MTRHIAGFAILHTIAATLLYVAWRADLLIPFFTADEIGLTAFVAAVAAIGVVGVGFRRWAPVEFLKEHLVTLGLLGTIIGFSMAITGLAEDFDFKMLGLHTALNTTLAGLAGSLWLALCERVLK